MLVTSAHIRKTSVTTAIPIRVTALEYKSPLCESAVQRRSWVSHVLDAVSRHAADSRELVLSLTSPSREPLNSMMFGRPSQVCRNFLEYWRCGSLHASVESCSFVQPPTQGPPLCANQLSPSASLTKDSTHPYPATDSHSLVVKCRPGLECELRLHETHNTPQLLDFLAHRHATLFHWLPGTLRDARCINVVPTMKTCAPCTTAPHLDSATLHVNNIAVRAT